jgi:hypothetical protein
MPHRDPDTGQFLPHDTAQYSDIEVASWGINVGVQASDLSGATGFSGGDIDEFEGVQALDYDQFVDRNEELVLLQAHHSLVVYANSTETADGTVAVSAEISADPSLSSATNLVAGVSTNDSVPPDSVVTSNLEPEADDSIDIIGRPLYATGTGAFSDGSSGAGGGGSAGRDTVKSDMFPAEFGRFHPRDELFVNGEFRVWNIDDAGVHAGIAGQHVYGVVQ